MKKYFQIILLLVCCFNSKAQNFKPKTASYKPRFYLGITRGYSKHEIFYKENIVQPGTFYFGPWQLVGGFTIHDKLAVETILLIHKESSRSRAEGISLDGLPMAEYLNSNAKGFAIPVKFKYVVRKNNISPFQIDIIGGVILVRQQADSEFTKVKNQQIVDYYYIEGVSSNMYATFGISGRYLLWNRLELVAESGFNRILKNVPAEVHRNIIGNPSGLTGNHNIGVRYRFDLKFSKK
ncbi:hypothetical protein [Hymenobacter sp. 102]|uniref:hypothetical protein n=1 Tax=Hymenobacter sp. 102 TaxID=3403152 RepID=UPI003CF69C21